MRVEGHRWVILTADGALADRTVYQSRKLAKQQRDWLACETDGPLWGPGLEVVPLAYVAEED